MLGPIGKVKLCRADDTAKKVDLWGVFSERRGRLRVQEVCEVLEWDAVFHVDKDEYEILLCAHDRGPLAGLSTDLFEPGQELTVRGRKNKENGASLLELFKGLAATHHDATKVLLEENQAFKECAAAHEQLINVLLQMREFLAHLSKVPTS